jgi:hypothetical protein
LIKFGHHPIYQITWKSPNPIDQFDEEWATRARKGAKLGGVNVDDGVHIEIMLEHLV